LKVPGPLALSYIALYDVSVSADALKLQFEKILEIILMEADFFATNKVKRAFSNDLPCLNNTNACGRTLNLQHEKFINYIFLLYISANLYLQ